MDASRLYSRLPTEQPHPSSRDLDRLSTDRLVRLMNREDQAAARAVGAERRNIARAVEIVSRALSRGGRLLLAGAGTSGRLCVLEAAECPPTFGTPPDLVRAFMAGGKASVFASREGAEDRALEAEREVGRKVRRGDVLVAAAASGVTPYALSALSAARRRGAATVLVTCNPRAAQKGLADAVVAPRTGPEVLTGSTRLKAGTATKMILNMLTTLSMIRLGKVYGHWMVDLQPRSRKLVARGTRLVGLLGGISEDRAAELLRLSGGRVKTAILMARKGLSRAEAERRLARARGFLRKALAGLLLFFSVRASASVLTGLDVLERGGFAELRGKRVGVVCNHTAVDARGRHLVDLLRRAEGVRLAAIFAPEHGFAGKLEHGRKVEHGRTPDGVPIYSLYGETKRPTPEMLEGLDVLVFDVQDTGARFYTYITTLGYALEAAAGAGLEFVVLDRPNPAGAAVEGEVLSDDVRHFTAYYSVPVRHGLTVGEIARWHNGKVGRGRLAVVPMEGWRRDMPWKRTGLRFLPPSPNIRSPRAALLYPGVGAFEATNVAVGRGTPWPFEVFGAPWMDGLGMARALEALELPGVRFRPVKFVPAKDRYAGQVCSGVRVRVTDERAIRPVEVFVHAAFLLRELHPADFQPRWEEMPRVTGSALFESLYKSGAPARDYIERIRADAARFLSARGPVLLYE